MPFLKKGGVVKRFHLFKFVKFCIKICSNGFNVGFPAKLIRLRLAEMREECNVKAVDCIKWHGIFTQNDLNSTSPNKFLTTNLNWVKKTQTRFSLHRSTRKTQISLLVHSIFPPEFLNPTAYFKALT